MFHFCRNLLTNFETMMRWACALMSTGTRVPNKLIWMSIGSRHAAWTPAWYASSSLHFQGYRRTLRGSFSIATTIMTLKIVHVALSESSNLTIASAFVVRPGSFCNLDHHDCGESMRWTPTWRKCRSRRLVGLLTGLLTGALALTEPISMAIDRCFALHTKLCTQKIRAVVCPSNPNAKHCETLRVCTG